MKPRSLKQSFTAAALAVVASIGTLALTVLAPLATHGGLL